jgi:hypothetical protein
MKVTIETITPAIAKKWLETNSANRNIRDPKIHEYANEMASGRWHETGDPYRFFEDGTLADSQHRLHAIVESGVTIKNAIVVRGLKKTAMAGIDVGAKRSVSDFMHLHHGVTNANVVCASVRAIYSLCFGYQNYVIGAGLTKVAIDAFGENIYQAYSDMSSFPPGKKAWVIGSLALAVNSYPDLEEFSHTLGTGENARRGNPALAVRNWLISGTSIHLSNGYKAGRYECIFNAMNASLKGVSLNHLKSGTGGLNVFKAKQRKFIELVRDEVRRLRPLKSK